MFRKENARCFCVIVSTCLHLFLHHCLFFFFFGHAAACGILVPQPGIKPEPSEVKAWSSNHWTAKEFPPLSFLQLTI